MISSNVFMTFSTPTTSGFSDKSFIIASDESPNYSFDHELTLNYFYHKFF